MEDRGLKEETRGTSLAPDEGWAYNPGKAGLDAWKPDLSKYSDQAGTLLKATLGKPLFLKRTTDDEIREFIRHRDDMPEGLQAFLSPLTVEEYREKGAKAYLTRSGRAGFAITEDKALTSVFSKPGARMGREAVEQAIELGAETLDCIDGKLPGFYDRLGFVEYDRIPWDDKYAPEGWDYKRFGRPDIVLMKRRTKGEGK